MNMVPMGLLQVILFGFLQIPFSQGEDIWKLEGKRIPRRSSENQVREKLLWVSSTPTRMSCAALCLQNSSCSFYGYQEQVCHGYANSETQAPRGEMSSIVQGYFRRYKPKAGSSHGIGCKGKKDCKIKNSVCYRGVCLCTLGFYFSPKQNSCLGACEEYGDGMDIYKGAGVKGHNDKTLHNTTLSSCLDFCVREKDFTCLTVDWSTDGICYLSRNGYLDVLFFYREQGLRDFTFGQRRCK